MQKFLLFLGAFSCVLFVAFAMVTYDAKMKAENLSKELMTERENVSLLETKLAEVSLKHVEYVDEVQTRFTRMEERTVLLEESIDPKNFRWASIKKIRDAVGDRHNLGSVIGVTQFATAVHDYSEEYDVPVTLILAVVKQESAFNPKAVSHAGAKGLMQLMPPTAKECADDVGRRYYNIFKVKDNVRFGTWYLWKMMDRFNGDMALAIRAYNCGPTCVEKVVGGEWGDYPTETRDYVERVLENKRQYENLGL